VQDGLRAHRGPGAASQRLKPILITGGSGFLGAWIAPAWPRIGLAQFLPARQATPLAQGIAATLRHYRAA